MSAEEFVEEPLIAVEISDIGGEEVDYIFYVNPADVDVSRKRAVVDISIPGREGDVSQDMGSKNTMIRISGSFMEGYITRDSQLQDFLAQFEKGVSMKINCSSVGNSTALHSAEVLIRGIDTKDTGGNIDEYKYTIEFSTYEDSRIDTMKSVQENPDEIALREAKGYLVSPTDGANGMTSVDEGGDGWYPTGNIFRWATTNDYVRQDALITVQVIDTKTVPAPEMLRVNYKQTNYGTYASNYVISEKLFNIQLAANPDLIYPTWD